MKPKEFMAKLDHLFTYIFPTANAIYAKSGFREAMGALASSHELDGLLVKPDGEIDVDWISFLWWIHYGAVACMDSELAPIDCSTACINDAIHGFLWTPEWHGHTLSDDSSLKQYIDTDPIARAERIKIKDYIKHISWVYHKTQVLPRITIIGSDNVPERLHGLHQSEIVLLDPKVTFPKEKLFIDHIQRRNFNTVSSDEIFDELGRKTDLLETQNVVIIDRPDLSIDELEQTIIRAGKLLTHHGRCLFDIPMYGKIARNSKLYGIASKIIKNQTRDISPSLAIIDDCIHEVIRSINESSELAEDNFSFEIEELKLTDVGLSCSVAVRVYLKKNKGGDRHD